MTETNSRKVPIFLALGSNLGNRMSYLQGAITKLSEKKNIQVGQQSGIYETEPMYVKEQEPFLNMVVAGSTRLSPSDLLTEIKDIEELLGRKERMKNGPREIDIDIIFYGDQIIEQQDLQIPHPGLFERKFVLQPLNDLAPGFVSPAHDKSISQLLRECPDDSSIRPFDKMI
jgi:2-amino-4-hydroxy-6-hydroxymethyldihydropteridine diphosphokinase